MNQPGQPTVGASDGDEDMSSISDPKLQQHPQKEWGGEEQPPHHPTAQRSFPCLQFISNLFFVLASILYLALSAEDLVWSKDAQDIPEHVLVADDDLTWVNFRKAERFQEAGGLDQYNDDDEGSMGRWLQGLLDYTTGNTAMTSPPNTTTATATTSRPVTISLTRAPTSAVSSEAPSAAPSAVSISVNTSSPTSAPVVADTLATPSSTEAAPSAAPTTASSATASSADTTSMPASDPSVWEEYWWEEMPPDVQAAFATLGWTAELWNSGGSVPTDALAWDELTPEQQEAALFLGYDQASWDGETMAPTEVANTTEPVTEAPGTDVSNMTTTSEEEEVEEATTSPNNNNDPSIYEDYYWQQLPPEIQAAFSVLGWNEELWNSGGSARTDDLSWDELTDEEREAARTIGYTRDTWDEGEGGGDVDYDSYDWDELPPEIQAAFETLGWTRESWNSGGSVRTDDLSWDELTEEEREAAMTIGYTQASWDGEGTAEDSVDGPSQWDGSFWHELPPDIQAALRVLGWNELLWNSGGRAPTDNLFWDQLSEEEQQAAAVVGYNQQLWDNSEVEDDYVSVDDDYVFEVKVSNTWVSRYMILYFSAAMCFVYVGLLDLIREKRIFHCFMIVAGMLGVASSMVVESNLRASNILNCLSVHFFLLEAFNLFGSHRREDLPAGGERMQYWLSFADVLFGIGALMDVILSYFWLKRRYEWNIPLNGVSVFAAALWLITSLIYISATLIHYYKSGATHENMDDIILGENNVAKKGTTLEVTETYHHENQSSDDEALQTVGGEVVHTVIEV